MSKVKRLVVDTPQGRSGLLLKDSRFSFGYEADDRTCEISLAMPIRYGTYNSTVLHPIFEMNRPEGYLLERIKKRFAKLGGLDDMALLKFTGHSQIGRLTLSDPMNQSKAKRPNLALREVLESRSQELFDHLVETYLESGVSGFQPKVLASASVEASQWEAGRKTGHTADLIVKSSGDDFPDLAQNEFLCMDAARRAGILCPDFWLSNDGGLFVMDRFDLSEDGSRLGFEDACALMLRPSGRKYESSYEMLTKMVEQYCGQEAEDSLQRLFEYVAFSVMVRNGDAHLKNFGLLYVDPVSSAPRLSPLYDVVTTSVYAIGSHPVTGATKVDRTMALKLAKTYEYPDGETLCRFGETYCGVRQPKLVLERIESGMRESLEVNKDRVAPWLHAAMSKEWDSGIWNALTAPGARRGPRPW